MSETFTCIETDPPTESFAFRGVMTRAETIAEARKHFGAELERLQKFLATPDDEFIVQVQKGLHVARNIRVLKP